MTNVFVICNQQGHFWGKKKMWVDGSEPKTLLRVKNRDEASNTLFELSSKDFELRGEIVEAGLSPKGDPIVQVSDIPLPNLHEDEEELDSVDEAAQEPTEEASQTEDAEVLSPLQ
ncbi:MAG: hypothetical protein ACI9DH_000964 [Halioglobus sp.]|jgi:hypothetical protein